LASLAVVTMTAELSCVTLHKKPDDELVAAHLKHEWAALYDALNMKKVLSLEENHHL
jgi:hypothetical protein